MIRNSSSSFSLFVLSCPSNHGNISRRLMEKNRLLTSVAVRVRQNKHWTTYRMEINQHVIYRTHSASPHDWKEISQSVDEYTVDSPSTMKVPNMSHGAWLIDRFECPLSWSDAELYPPRGNRWSPAARNFSWWSAGLGLLSEFRRDALLIFHKIEWNSCTFVKWFLNDRLNVDASW